MKRALVILLLGGTIVALSSCGDFANSLNSQSFDPGTNPLDSPGSGSREELVDAGPKFPRGSWVEVTDANAGLFNRVPQGNEQARYSLTPGTTLKVVGNEGTYVKVETESGEIGYVPAIMVAAQPSGNELPILSSDPSESAPPIDPLEAIDPIDPLDPAESLPAPGADGGFVAPEPEVPPISVEESPPPPTPIVPPDPVEESPGQEE